MNAECKCVFKIGDRVRVTSIPAWASLTAINFFPPNYIHTITQIVAQHLVILDNHQYVVSTGRLILIPESIVNESPENIDVLLGVQDI